MDAVKDIFDSIISVVKDRLVNPFYGAFAIAWVVINYEFLLVFFGSIPYLEKLEYIDNTIFLDSKAWLNGLLYPAIVAFGYIFITPFVYRAVSFYQKTIEKRTIELLLEIAGDTPMPKEAAAGLLERMKRERERLNSRIDDLYSQNQASASMIENLANENRGLKSRISELTKYSPSEGEEKNSLPTSSDSESMPVMESLLKRSPSWRFDLYEKDFGEIGSVSIVKRLVARGFSAQELMVMHWLQGGRLVSQDDVFEAFKLPNEKGRELLDELRSAEVLGMGSSHHATTGESTSGYVLTTIGQQVLEAYSRRKASI